MDRRVKERLVGATILAVLIVVIVPELLSGPRSAVPAPSEAASAPLTAVRNVTVDLATRGTAPAENPAPAPTASAAAGPPVDATPAAGAASVPATAPLPSGATDGVADPAQSPAAPVVTSVKPQQPPLSGGGHDAVTAAAHHDWAVQLGSFASRVNAEQQIRKLKVHDAAVYLSSSGIGSSLRYRVRMGPFADRSAAESAVAKLRKEGQVASLVAP